MNPPERTLSYAYDRLGNLTGRTSTVSGDRTERHSFGLREPRSTRAPANPAVKMIVEQRCAGAE